MGSRPLPLLALAAALLACDLAAGQDSAPRPAAAIIRDFHAVRMPSLSDGTSPEAIERFRRAIDEGCRAQGRFALELLAGHPTHPELPELMRTRWAGMNNALDETRTVLAETAKAIAAAPTPAFARVAWTSRARAAVLADDMPLAERRAIVLDAAREAPGDEHAAFSLVEFARWHSTTPEDARALVDRVLEDHAGSEWAAPEAKHWRRALERVGKPHREEFADFRSGKAFDSDASPGPRIVLYASPTVPDAGPRIERAVRLLAPFRARGVAVCGVQDGSPWDGEEALERWLAAKGIDWPWRIALPPDAAQPWETGLSLPSVPFAVLIGPDGKVRHVSGGVEALLPLLEGLLGEESGRGERL